MKPTATAPATATSPATSAPVLIGLAIPALYVFGGLTGQPSVVGAVRVLTPAATAALDYLGAVAAVLAAAS